MPNKESTGLCSQFGSVSIPFVELGWLHLIHSLFPPHLQPRLPGESNSILFSLSWKTAKPHGSVK